jgi:hypothetical protein
MSEPMYTVGFIVRLRLPERITPEDAQRDLQTCISFGQAELSAPWVIPDANAEPQDAPPGCYCGTFGCRAGCPCICHTEEVLVTGRRL